MGTRQRLLNYLRKVFLHDPNVWVHKGKLEQLCKEAGYLGDQGTRRLRELHQDGKIDRRKKGISLEYRYCPDMEELAKVIDKL